MDIRYYLWRWSVLEIAASEEAQIGAWIPTTKTQIKIAKRLSEEGFLSQMDRPWPCYNLTDRGLSKAQSMGTKAA